MTGRRGTLQRHGSADDFSHDPLERVVGVYLLPVDVREGVVGERFGHAPLDEIGRRVHPDGAQVVDDGARLSVGRVPALLGMDSLEHMAHLADFGRWNVAEYIPVEMHHATLPASFGQVLGGALREATAGIRNDQLHALEAASAHQVLHNRESSALQYAMRDRLTTLDNVQNLSHFQD